MHTSPYAILKYTCIAIAGTTDTVMILYENQLRPLVRS
jgi:hypothetical protein